MEKNTHQLTVHSAYPGLPEGYPLRAECLCGWWTSVVDGLDASFTWSEHLTLGTKTDTTEKEYKVTYKQAIYHASNLKSEDGENPEYDRALVELIWDLFAFDREKIARDMKLNISSPQLYERFEGMI